MQGDSPAPVLTVQELRLLTGFTRQTIVRYIQAGRLPGFKKAGRWLIPSDQLRPILRGAIQAKGGSDD